MRADYHMHTNYSTDSDTDMEDLVRHAIELGLDEIAITDHVDYGINEGKNTINYSDYMGDIENLQEKYGDEIRIRKGIEFGMQTHTIPQYQEDFDNLDFDFVIMSVHQIDNKEFWIQEYQKGLSQKQINEGYYKELLSLVENYKDYSVLGHLDAIKRDDEFGIYPDEKVIPIIEEILKIVIEDGKGIEVNSSCYRYGLPDLTPSVAILKKYKELGGRILTLGSDAHTLEDVEADFDRIKGNLKELGYTEITCFEKMKPIFYDL